VLVPVELELSIVEPLGLVVVLGDVVVLVDESVLGVAVLGVVVVLVLLSVVVVPVAGGIAVVSDGAVVVVVVVLVVELVSGPVVPWRPAGAPESGVLCATAIPATTTRQAAAALVKRVTRVFMPMTPRYVEEPLLALCREPTDAPSAVSGFGNQRAGAWVPLAWMAGPWRGIVAASFAGMGPARSE
jgi:hypothetical protein